MLFLSGFNLLVAQEKGYKDAIFPGGKEGWLKYVERNVNGSLGKLIPNPKELERVQQSAFVSFIVDTDGVVRDVIVTNYSSLHPKLVEEAIRVIKGSPKWKPAMSNGQFIRYKGIQTITWEHGKGKFSNHKIIKSKNKVSEDISTFSSLHEVKKRDTIYSSDTTLSNGLVKPSPDKDSVFRMIQAEAIFPGGYQGWKNYLIKNLNSSLGERYISIPKGQSIAKVKVNVEFLVDKDGNITQIHADSISIANVHEKLVEEAIRVIKESPKWIPAWQNGHHVAYRGVQPISFVSKY